MNLFDEFGNALPRKGGDFKNFVFFNAGVLEIVMTSGDIGFFVVSPIDFCDNADCGDIKERNKIRTDGVHGVHTGTDHDDQGTVQ